MEVFTHTALQMAILFSIVVVGALARRLGFMSDAFDAQLTALIMNVTLPAMMIDSVLSNTDLPAASELLSTLGWSSVFYVLVIALALLYVRIALRGAAVEGENAGVRGAHAYCICFSNAGFMGLPILAAVLGSDAVLYGAVYVISFNIFAFSIGYLFVVLREGAATGGGHAKTIARAMLSPCLISSFIALGLALAHITNTGYIGQTFALLGGVTSPLSMLLVGSSLARQSVRNMVGDPRCYATAALRLIAVPLFVFALGSQLVASPTVLAVCVILAAMPSPAIANMMSIQYGTNAQINATARCIFITTLFSLVTLPAIATLVA